MQNTLHDPNKCNCDLDNGCTCQCPKCLAYVAARVRGMRLLALEDRLKKAGIDVEDFADLIWAYIEGGIEAKISKMTTEQIKGSLKGIKLVSAVKWDSIE